MTHVTDERTDRPLGRDLRAWLEQTIEELPEGGELPSTTRTQVLSRLTGMPQRRRWWPLRWHPFGIGATRSAGAAGSRPEGRTRSMFTATRVVVITAIVALGGSFALAIRTGGPETVVPAAPTASAPTDAVWVTGGDQLVALTQDYHTTYEGDVAQLRGGVVTLTTEMSDPRVSGTITFAFSVDAFHGDAGTEWGTMLIENEGGTWTGPCAGSSKSGGDPYAASCWLTGSGDYTGYTYYRQHVWGESVPDGESTQGLIFTGQPPTEYPEVPTAADQ